MGGTVMKIFFLVSGLVSVLSFASPQGAKAETGLVRHDDKVKPPHDNALGPKDSSQEPGLPAAEAQALEESKKNKLFGLIGWEFKKIKDEAMEAVLQLDLCDYTSSLIEPPLNRLWGEPEMRAKFVDACNGNPRAKNLFPKLSEDVIKSRIQAYCEFKPVFRLCMVCKRLSNTAKDLSGAYEGCRGYLDQSQHADFEKRVLGRQ
jgi:hypothetical protein